MRLDLSRRLAGVVELPQVPHHLDEIVTRVLVVSAAGVRFAYVLAPVGASLTQAGQPQPRVLPVTRDGHGAVVLSLGVEFDGVAPDVLSLAAVILSLSWPEAAGEQ